MTSAAAAWAVGQYCISNCGTFAEVNRTIILRWDGHDWSKVAGLNKGGGAQLRAVAPDQRAGAWAVGNYCAARCGTKFTVQRAFILHWNGSAWTQTAGPSPGTSSWLSAISVAPDGDAWAVGGFTRGVPSTASATTQTLILRWNGTSWKRLPSPSPGLRASLAAVNADSHGDAWAVGRACLSSCLSISEVDRPLILHWNGSSWSRVPSPNPAGNSVLNAVSVGQAGSVWAVGSSCASGCFSKPKIYRSLIMHWDGAVWVPVSSPSRGSSSWLESVSASPSGQAWAVGGSCVTACGTPAEIDRALILRSDGGKWSTVANPRGLGKHPVLYSVSSAPPGFIVGRVCASACFSLSERYRTLILRWNGTALVKG